MGDWALFIMGVILYSLYGRLVCECHRPYPGYMALLHRRVHCIDKPVSNIR